MHCPKIENFQSLSKGQKRLDRATESLGEDVVRKILGYSLYILGYTSDCIFQKTNISESGLRLIVQELYQNGVERFVDKRKNQSYTDCKEVSTKSMPASCIKISEDKDKDIIEFSSTSPIFLQIKKSDKLGKKALSIILLDCKLISIKDTLGILKCRRQAIYRNHKDYKSMGVKGLVDNRVGQQKDYKYGEEMKSKIIKDFFSTIINGHIPSKTSITEHLNQAGLPSCSERSIARHLRNFGLTEYKENICQEIGFDVNERINSLDYTQKYEVDFDFEHNHYIKPLKQIKQWLCNLYENLENNIFEFEQKIEEFQLKLQPLILESLLAVAKKKIDSVSKLWFI